MIGMPATVSSARDQNDTGARLAYIPELDGLRALAIGAVLLDHTMPRYFPGGFIGVDIFFVLSGYLITTILCREFERENRIGLGNFYVRRALRLMPALLAMLAVYLLVVIVCKIVLADDRFVHDHVLAVLSSVLYVMNWTQAFDIGTGGYLVHTWSLAIEEQFYILWPLTLIAILRFNDRDSAWKSVLLLILLVTGWRTLLVMKGASPKHVYGGLDTRIDTLLIGCLLALAPLARFQSLATRFSLCAVLILAVMSMTISWTSPLLYLLGFPVIALCAASLILAAMTGRPHGVLRRFLSWAPLNYCGKISYGFYLWHYPISCVVTIYFGGTHFGQLKTLAATAISTLLIASMSYWMLELPVLRLGRKFR